MFSGIKKRLVGTYLVLITLTVVLILGVFIFSINLYYIDNIKSFISVQADTICSYYRNYLSNTDLKYNAGKIVNDFPNLPLQIQVTDTNGKVLADSLHQTFGNVLATKDIADATSGKASFSYDKSFTGERILSYTTPLSDSSKIQGTIKLTASLTGAHKAIKTLSAIAILAGIFIIGLVFIISLYLSNTLISPVKKLTDLAYEISKGNYKIKVEIKSKDEIGVLASSINHMVQEMGKNEELKNEFISSISHELRTPLTSIKGWAVTMGNTSPEDMIIKRGIEIINSESDRLSEMVEELLDFSRLQAGKFSLKPEKTDITKLIHDVCHQMLQRAERQGIMLNDLVEDKPLYIEVDSRRIRQVLINLLDNSLKFTPSGGIISVYGKSISSNKDALYEFIVEDTGSGIGEDDLPNITQRFYRGVNADEKSGIGLGLSICNELIKSHKGTLEIQSQMGKGTKVIIRLPQLKS